MTSALEFCVDLYAVLGTNNKCSDEELKRTYQKLILQYHPDKIDRDLPKHEQDKCLERFIEIDKAWKILGHAEKRKEYDAKYQENAVSRKWPVNSEIDLDEMDYNEADGYYGYHCRCGGEYVITEDDMIGGTNVICCDTCTLSVKVTYQLQQDEAT